MVERWEPDDPDALERSALDKVPLVVPPTAGKSTFFSNETIRAQWQICQQRIAEAADVFIGGYSLPVTDTMVRWMLQTVHQDVSAFPRVTVVNTDERLLDRIEHISYDVPRYLASVSDLGSLLGEE